MEAHDTVRNIRRDIRAAVHSYPEAKQKAKDATNSDAWGPSDEQKEELAKMARDSTEARGLIYRAVWKRAYDESSYWRHVAKALAVLEWFLIRDVPDIRAQLSANAEHLQAVATSYKRCEDDDPMRKAATNENVRAKAKRLLALADDREMLAAEAERVRVTAARMRGISSDAATPPAHPIEVPPTRATPEPRFSTSVSPQRSPRPGGTSPTPGTSAQGSPQTSAVQVARLDDVLRGSNTTSPSGGAQGIGPAHLSAGHPHHHHRGASDASSTDLFSGSAASSPARPSHGATPPLAASGTQVARPGNATSPSTTAPAAGTASAAGANFDPFADVNTAMAEEEARRSGSRQAEAYQSKRTVSDFFDNAGPPTKAAATPPFSSSGTSPVAAYQIVPPPPAAAGAGGDGGSSRRASRGGCNTKDETDAMLAELTLHGGRGGPRRASGAGSETLQDLMARRGQ